MITSDMTIDQIIRRVYPKDKDLWPQIKAKLIETNPGSFVQYSDRLIPGSRLKLVDIRRIYDQEQLDPKIKVGYVARLEGNATARDLNGRVQQLQINSQIFEGDRIETELGARIQILMDDGAEVYLKEDSVLKISEYVITAGYNKESSSILDLLRGGLRKITGAIGSSALANYQLQTGLATIGIRGTDYVLKLCKQDDCTQTVSRNDPDAKLHAVVLEGAITMTTDEEVQILMAMGEYGTATPEILVVAQIFQRIYGFQTLYGIGRHHGFRWCQEVGIGTMVGASNAPAKLVQLCETEAIGPVDDDRIRRWHVDSTFHDRGAQEHVESPVIEVEHDLF